MAFAVTTTSLPNGKAGVAYSFTLQSSGGTGAVTWALIAGTLPAGLSLAASTGVISGTPSAGVPVNATPLTFEATDSDSNTADSSGLTLTIANTVVPVGSATPNPNASQTFPLMPPCWPLTVIPGSDPVSAQVPPLAVPQQPDPSNTEQNDVIDTALTQAGQSGVRLA